MRQWEQDRKSKAEAKPLPARATLRSLVQALPTPWLAALAKILGARNGRRSERGIAVAQALKDTPYLRRTVLDTFGADERHLLDSVLFRGGIEKASTSMRRYGSDEADGWFWVERPPRSIMGRVRLHGLAFVGTQVISGRRHRMLVIPEELREPLRTILAATRDALWQ